MTQFHRHEPPDLPPVERRCPACQGWGRLGSDIWCDRCDGTGEIAPRPESSASSSHADRTGDSLWPRDGQ